MILAVLSFLGAAAPCLASDSAPATEHQPAPCMRITRPHTNRIELQIASRPFHAPKPGQPVIWLMAVSHIGESNYYASVQADLNRQDLVLFEGVGGGEAMKRQSRLAKQAAAGNATEPSDQEPQTASLQSAMAESLGLAFQLEAIDYDHPHFQNSDMSIAQLQAVMMKTIAETADDTAESSGAGVEFLALMQAMDGSSWMGAILQMGVRLLGSSPKLQALTRLMMIEVLGQLEGDMAGMKGLPPNMQELIRVLIQERNKVVMQDLQRTLKAPQLPASIAVFYGAAHMDDLEKRLVTELNYQPGPDIWRSAIAVDIAQAGLSAGEIETVRSLVRWQMQMLKLED